MPTHEERERDGSVSTKLIHVEDRESVRTVTLSRPERRNALNEALRLELDEILRATAADTSCAVVVVRGDGPSFCGGADLRELDARLLGPRPEQRLASSVWQRLLDDLEALPQVTVAAVHGHVVGGGVLLALACDLRVAATDVVWTVPEVGLGLPLTWAGIPRLVREIGVARARELVMTCRPVAADEARELGLVHRLAGPEGLDAALEELTGALAASPRAALLATKAAFTGYGRHVGGHALAWADPDLLAYAIGGLGGQ